MIVNTQSTPNKTKKYQALLKVPDTFSTNFALYNYLSSLLFPLKMQHFRCIELIKPHLLMIRFTVTDVSAILYKFDS